MQLAKQTLRPVGVLAIYTKALGDGATNLTGRVRVVGIDNTNTPVEGVKSEAAEHRKRGMGISREIY